MPTFFMFGKYSSDGIRGISPERTQGAYTVIKEAGGEVKSTYALLGEYDLVIIADLPGAEEAMKVSAALNMLTKISFSTCEAILASDFDRLMSEAQVSTGPR